MADIEDRRMKELLADAAVGTRYPPPPALDRAVVASILDQPPARPRVAWRLAGASVGLALVLSLGGILLEPGTRTAVGEFLGVVEGQRIDLEATAPGVPGAGASDALPQSAVPVTLSEAGQLLGFTPAVPSGQGTPHGTYMVEWGDQHLLILRFAEFDLWQTRGSGFFAKQPSAAQVLLVGDRPAWWISDAAHETAFYDADGVEVPESRRTVERGLLAWNGADGRYYRVETVLTLEEAVGIAETLR